MLSIIFCFLSHLALDMVPDNISKMLLFILIFAIITLSNYLQFYMFLAISGLTFFDQDDDALFFFPIFMLYNIN